MFCPNCGSEVEDGARFCGKCGAAILTEAQAANAVKLGTAPRTAEAGTIPEAPEPLKDQAVPGVAPQPGTAAQPGATAQPGAAVPPTPNIRLCPDGVYRWVYELHLMRNPVILGTLCKVMGVITLLLYLFMAILGIVEGNAGALVEMLPAVLGFFALMMALCVLGYLIYAAMNGWKYIVLFEMDETGVRHIQQPAQFDKAQGVAWLLALAGLATGNPGRVGQAMVLGSKGSSYTEFARAKGMKVLRSQNTIKINETLEHNMVYAEPEDFDFVLNYIRERVPENVKGR